MRDFFKNIPFSAELFVEFARALQQKHKRIPGSGLLYKKTSANFENFMTNSVKVKHLPEVRREFPGILNVSTAVLTIFDIFPQHFFSSVVKINSYLYWERICLQYNP
jgi:hypothetical protein